MTCAHCLSHQATIRELREELEAWRAYDVTGPELVDNTRLCRWRTAFGMTGGQANYLILLADAAPRALNRDWLIENRFRAPGVKEERFPHNKTVDVQLSKIRSRLKAMGWPGEIKSEWGFGWCLSEADAASLKAIAGEAA